MMKSIRRRTFSYFTTAILVLTLAFSSLLYVYFDDTLRRRIDTNQLYSTEQTGNSVASVLMNIKQIAYYLCCSETISNELMNVNNHGAFAQQNFITRALSDALGPLTSPLMQSAYPVLFIDPQFPFASSIAGEPFSLDNVQLRRLYNLADVKNAGWYKETVARNGQIYTFTDPSNDRDVFFAHLYRNIYIADPRYSEVVGVVLYAMPKSRILSILKNIDITDDTVSLFMYGDDIIASTNERLFPSEGELPFDASLLSSAKTRDAIARLNLDGRDYAVSSASLNRDWKIVLLVPSGVFTRHFRDLLPIFVIFTAALLVIGLVLSGLFSRRLTRPILTLSDVMRRAQDSATLPPAVPAPDTRDEIAVLYESYNFMTERIRALTEQMKAEEEEKRAAELKTLQAQINPHFIYNTLDSVACIALLSGADDIVTMVSSLIDILKYSIQFQRATVTLREEITYLERYVQIQHLRYADGFTFSCDVPEEYDDVRISQIILQPLVENSLFHAVRTGGKLEIRLYCEEEGDLLHIHVTDNGSSANADELNRSLESSDTSERFGIGIRNVHKRIHLHMGENYGLRYENLPSGGLDAIVTIPLRFD